MASIDTLVHRFGTYWYEYILIYTGTYSRVISATIITSILPPIVECVPGSLLQQGPVPKIVFFKFTQLSYRWPPQETPRGDVRDLPFAT